MNHSWFCTYHFNFLPLYPASLCSLCPECPCYPALHLVNSYSCPWCFMNWMAVLIWGRSWVCICWPQHSVWYTEVVQKLFDWLNKRGCFQHNCMNKITSIMRTSCPLCLLYSLIVRFMVIITVLFTSTPLLLSCLFAQSSATLCYPTPATVQIARLEKTPHSCADWPHCQYMATSSSGFLAQKCFYIVSSVTPVSSWVFHTLCYFLRLLTLPLSSSFSAHDLALHITKKK